LNFLFDLLSHVYRLACLLTNAPNLVDDPYQQDDTDNAKHGEHSRPSVLLAVYCESMTAIEEMARRYGKRQRGIELKKRLATLEDSLQDYPRVWSRIGAAVAQYGQPGVVICVEADQSESTQLSVKKPKLDGPDHLYGHVSPMQTIATALVSYFNIGALIELVREIEETKSELAAIREFCQRIDDPLD
jgi:hypothetical protein